MVVLWTELVASEVTVLGIITVFRLGFPENALAPIVVTPSGMSILVIPVQE